MRCASCAIFIEDLLNKQDGIKNVKVNFKNHTVDLFSDTGKSREEIATFLSPIVAPHRYTISFEKIILEKKVDDVIWKALPIGLVFLTLFFVLQKSGVLNFGIGGVATPTTSFIVGVIASLSSCLAIVGGLVLSLSAEITKDDSKNKKPLVLFHAGRLIGFALLGGALGLLGQAIGINFIFSSILGLVAALVMIMLGLNLVGIFKKGKLTLPSGIFSFFRKVEHQTFAPIIIGLGTFFLPCGFTQSMQVAALSSGSFMSGMLIMFSFALGTFPMLALISFGSASFAHSKYAPLFFKSAGVIVIGLGIFALLAGLAGIGIINPLFSI